MPIPDGRIQLAGTLQIQIEGLVAKVNFTHLSTAHLDERELSRIRYYLIITAWRAP